MPQQGQDCHHITRRIQTSLIYLKMFLLSNDTDTPHSGTLFHPLVQNTISKENATDLLNQEPQKNKIIHEFRNLTLISHQVVYLYAHSFGIKFHKF
jgi:hypothetical protein